MDIRLLTVQNIALQEYFKIIKYLSQLKNTLNILMVLFELICGSLTEYQKNIENITKSESNFAPTWLINIY